MCVCMCIPIHVSVDVGYLVACMASGCALQPLNASSIASSCMASVYQLWSSCYSPIIVHVCACVCGAFEAIINVFSDALYAIIMLVKKQSELIYCLLHYVKCIDDYTHTCDAGCLACPCIRLREISF